MDDGRREDPGTRLGSWKGLVPLGMAAAAALLIGGGVDTVHRHQRAAEKEHEAKPAAKAEKTEPTVVVGVGKQGTSLLVRDVGTGANVGLPVAAPQGRRFHRVAALKDGSYIVATPGDRDVTFQRLRLDDGRPKDLKPVPKATVPGGFSAWSDLAVTPDGAQIAYVTYRGTRARVDVLSPETGVHKVWTTKLRARVGSLSWSGTTLSFVWSPVGSAAHQVRTLDTSGAAGDLKTSKAAMALPKGSSNAVLSRDGNSLIAAVAKNSELTLQTYTLQGNPTKTLWTQKVKGLPTGLDIAHTGRGLMVTAGDLYAQGVPTVPGEDLADAAW
ncbi:hypothetical protein [Actinomadura sp. WMMA1423]|uniref:hypothetical protein n=1 Tax=Actinomadura sp. WMMA1423 TaxID=2591108 RepID=UPI0011475615|nr:hypothetical protein [Actinomadura sp. WMMA1423]